MSRSGIAGSYGNSIFKGTFILFTMVAVFLSFLEGGNGAFYFIWNVMFLTNIKKKIMMLSHQILVIWGEMENS